MIDERTELDVAVGRSGPAGDGTSALCGFALDYCQCGGFRRMGPGGHMTQTERLSIIIGFCRGRRCVRAFVYNGIANRKDLALSVFPMKWLILMLTL